MRTRRVASLFATLLLVALVGCTLDSIAVSTPAAITESGILLKGQIYGGRQPIAGARVYLLAAATTGYGSASTSLSAGNSLDSVGAYVLTDSTGSFTLTATSACTSSQQTYILALGGDSGSGPNPASALMAAVGPCRATSSLQVDELTTIALAYAAAGFAIDATHISSSSTALAAMGLANAFANVANLSSNPTTPAGNGTVPIAEINTLANILSACITSNPINSVPCRALFENVSGDGTVTTDTASAAVNIAHHPATNVAVLFALQPLVPLFTPALTVPPIDFTLALTFTGGGLSTSLAQQDQSLQAVNNLAVDAFGNLWKPNYATNSITEISPLGAALSGPGGFTGGGLSGPANIAVDLFGNIWTPNTASSTVSKFTASGTPAPGSPFGAGILNQPSDLAIDPSNNVWIASASTLAKLNTDGSNSPGSPFASNPLNRPIGIAVLPGGGVWVSNAYSDTISVYTSDGAAAESPHTAGSLAYPYGIAFDSSLNAYITNESSVSELSSAGINMTGSPYHSPAGTIPTGVAVDGAGHAWITDITHNAILEIASGRYVSGAVGFQTTQSSMPEAIAIDGSGNVWYTSFNDATLHELVGAATPTVTPLAYAVKNSLLGTRP